jgi:adenylate cyclase
MRAAAGGNLARDAPAPIVDDAARERPAAAEPPVDGALLDRLSSAVAIADPDTLTVVDANARFREWFPAGSSPVATLATLIPGFDAARAAERSARGRPYRVEVDVPGVSARPVAVRVEVRPDVVAGARVLIAEAQNITRQREAEYMLDSYARMMERQARELEQERERAERLLLNIMPPSIVAELRDFGTTTPQTVPAASVLMLDFVGFTEMAITRDPGALIAELNDVFTSFDRIVDHCRADRIKTIGDAYMAVSGMPDPHPDHEFHIARSALRMRRFIERRNRSARHQWRCRIGLASGPMIGSIVGVQKYVYDVFGMPVNLASRLEALCEPMQILITADMAARIGGDFVVRPLAPVEIRGFGEQRIFALEDEARRGR